MFAQDDNNGKKTGCSVGKCNLHRLIFEDNFDDNASEFGRFSPAAPGRESPIFLL
jgi:hypothetical protein